MDAGILQQVLELRRPWLDDLMVAASALGAGGFLWIVIGSIAGIFPRHTAAMWRLWLAVALAYVIVDVFLKPFAAWPRPFEVIEVQLIDARPATASFPSGHAAAAAAGALAATRIFPSARWIFWMMAALIGFSRIYLGVHWPSDVVAGAALGWAVGWFVVGGPAVKHSPSSYF